MTDYRGIRTYNRFTLMQKLNHLGNFVMSLKCFELYFSYISDMVLVFSKEFLNV